MVRRFEIARAIGIGNAGLFHNEDNTPGAATGFPLLTSRLFFDAIGPVAVGEHDGLIGTRHAALARHPSRASRMLAEL